MVIDTSAILALLLGEPEAELIARSITSDPKRLISAFSLLETSIVVEARKGADGGREWELLRLHAGLDIIPFTATQHTLALEAWRRYGKGRHKASLNIGDCCSYSLSKMTGEPLLFKGVDFALTDITPVLEL